jgi:hypothetical protein
MRRFPLLFLLAVLCLTGAEKKKKQPDLEVLELKVQRIEGKVAVDGRVRNTGEKTWEGVMISFDFLAPGNVPVTTQKTNLDDEVMAPGQESGFRAEMVDPVRAVECVISGAEDKVGHDLRLSKAIRVAIE